MTLGSSVSPSPSYHSISTPFTLIIPSSESRRWGLYGQEFIIIIIIIIIIIDFKKFYNRLRQPKPNVKNAPGKEEVENSGEKCMGKKFHIMKKRAG